MKFLKILIVSFVLLCTTLAIQAQALVSKDFNWWLLTSGSGCSLRYYKAINTMEIYTPSGNILHKQEFLLSEDDLLVPSEGVNKVVFKTDDVLRDEIKYIYDFEGLVFSDGRCVIIFHSNGSGDDTPAGKRPKK